MIYQVVFVWNVRQGAASSVLLFNCFMDGLFQHLEENCSREALLNDIHTLIHANDTIILSTSRNKFIHKCNELVTFLDENHLNLNIGKSGYFIINPKTCDIKGNILNSGVLKYNASFEYLGVFVSDTGSLKQDVKKYIGHKRSVSIKYTNFRKTNKNALLYAKLEVLDKCVTSAIIYGCETWGKCTSDVELCYRSGLKTALNVRQNLNEKPGNGPY